ncbi:ABC transporter substrate-binding protein [Bordetella genomosp. 9]|uniref:ABC transporter substrate-binding protein n=2 Tax=Bordetella genomosp. 9 TaxID=1416803 RepID=A0A261RGL0_9BORD|nr:ABC transporter substrate-binding protein [Bordetella genomosp. 9]
MLAVPALLCAAGGTAVAGGYPSGPVSVVVPFSPGGGSDSVARLISARLGAKLHQSFIVENKPGGSTNPANEYVIRAAPDGQKLLLGQVTLSINPSLMPNLPYAPLRDLAPVAHIGDTPVILVTSPQFPPTDLPTLMDYVRKHPGKINFASGGVGTSVHLAGELFKLRTGLEMAHIPYRGSSQMVTDLIGGQVQMIFNTASSVVPMIKAGKLRAIAVSGAHRLKELPDVPTFTEAGLDNFDAPSWYGLMAPKDTPDAIVRLLNTAVDEILREPDVRESLSQIGVEPAGGTPADFAHYLREQQAMWAKVIKASHIQTEP